MAGAEENRVLMPKDLMYLLTFTLGMAAFWVSGHASSLLPAMKSQSLATITSLGVTGGVFGLIMLVFALIVLRKFVSSLIATVIAVVLGLATAQVVAHLAAGHIHNREDVGILTFILYLLYGLIYVIALTIGRKVYRSK